MAEKVTEMLLKVDLNCYSCTKKLKKILCKFPQIRDRIYDEKNNTVKITVVCCSPEKIRDKLCCRGGKVIKTIEILEPSKPKAIQPEKKKEADKPAKEPEKLKQQQKEPDQKPKESGKPKIKEAKNPKEAEKPNDNGKPKESEKPRSNGKPPAQEKPKEAAPPKPPQPAPVAAVPVPVAMIPPKQPEPVPNIPAPTMMAATACPMQFYSCGQCSGGPCCHGYGMPVAPPPCYDNYGNAYGYAYGQGGGGGGGYYGYNNQRCHLDRCCDYYFSEDNPSSCAIM